MKVLLLSGFLGTSSDFHKLRQAAPAHFEVEEFHPSLNRRQVLSSLSDYPTWQEWRAAQIPHLKKWSDGEPLRALGYSLGGRLLASLVDQDPSLFSEVSFVSSHPGLSVEFEKADRLSNDTRWAQRFLLDPWDSLMRDWNAQPVFHGCREPDPLRQEADYQRQTLAHLLEKFSLAKQPNFQSKRWSWPVRQFWWAGERDEKFRNLIVEASHHQPRDLSPQQKPELHFALVKDAGHRLLIDAREELQTWLYQDSGLS